MKKSTVFCFVCAGMVVLALGASIWVRALGAQQASAVPDAASQVTGTPGSPSATTD